MATGQRFAYIKKVAKPLPANVIGAYQELAMDTAFSWKDFLTSFFLTPGKKLVTWQKTWIEP